MDPETRALWNAVESGKIVREADIKAIRIAALKETIAEMRMAAESGQRALQDAEATLAILDAG